MLVLFFAINLLLSIKKHIILSKPLIIWTISCAHRVPEHCTWDKTLISHMNASKVKPKFLDANILFFQAYDHPIELIFKFQPQAIMQLHLMVCNISTTMVQAQTRSDCLIHTCFSHY